MDMGRGRATTEFAIGVYPDGIPGERPYNRRGLLHHTNRNNLGITLDLDAAEREGGLQTTGKDIGCRGEPIRSRRLGKAGGCLSEHNHYVLHDLLCMSEEEMTCLEQERIIGTKPLPGADKGAGWCRKGTRRKRTTSGGAAPWISRFPRSRKDSSKRWTISSATTRGLSRRQETNLIPAGASAPIAGS